MRTFSIIAILFSLTIVFAHADTVVMYGDQDGFGEAATTYKDPLINSAGPGEAEGTDVRLIGTGFAAPPFAPTATLAFEPLLNITGITISMSMAEFGGNISPVNGPNSIVLDGLAVDSAFLDSFTSFPYLANPNIEEKSFSLPAAFFPLFADGFVDLTGTLISERSGFGSFQIDYIQFDIAGTSAIPEPTSLLLLGTGLGAIGLAVWRKRK